MTGSMRWGTYNTDAGAATSVFRDESNLEALVGTTPITGPFGAANPGLSSLIKPRYANCQLSTNPLIRKKFMVGTLTAFNLLIPGAQISEAGTPALLWNVTSKVGEKSRIPTNVDTGQTDGD